MLYFLAAKELDAVLTSTSSKLCDLEKGAGRFQWDGIPAWSGAAIAGDLINWNKMKKVWLENNIRLHELCV